MLLAKQSYRHAYPHSWRSKAPVIYRNTAQWFIAMDDENALRKKSLAALETVNFFPQSGKERLRGMIENRPDWCISRQRAWGVPLPIFVEKANGEILRDDNVLKRIVAAFAEEGADCWFGDDAKARFLGDDYPHQDYEQVRDVVDVWFDSGSTHSFVLKQRKGQTFPASLYLEGSDQHRGWFQSSLLVGAGLSNQAPYQNVLTHGFTLDKDGRKMSKSIGNAMAPEDIVNQYGADILRLWVVNVDYRDDMRLSDEIIKRLVDSYRRIRNTLRFLLGNLQDVTQPTEVDYDDLPELEKYVLARMSTLEQHLEEAIAAYDYTSYSHKIYDFCHWLSYGYFDIRKDCLYCDGTDDFKRNACLSVLSLLFDFITTRIAPILCFTAEEAWQCRGRTDSVMMEKFSPCKEEWQNHDLAEKWHQIFTWRDLVNAEIERARNEGIIKSSLEASFTLELSPRDFAMVEAIDLAEIFITAPLTLQQGDDENVSAAIAVGISKASGAKCERCWRVRKDVSDAGLCVRCDEVQQETKS